MAKPEKENTRKRVKAPPSKRGGNRKAVYPPIINRIPAGGFYSTPIEKQAIAFAVAARRLNREPRIRKQDDNTFRVYLEL